MFPDSAEGAGPPSRAPAVAGAVHPRYSWLVDRIVGQLFRRYALAGVIITTGVVGGVVLAQRQHMDAFPAREGEPVPCMDACQKRSTCAGDDVARCAALCHALAASQREATRAAVQCVLQRPCAELASCGGTW